MHVKVQLMRLLWLPTRLNRKYELKHFCGIFVPITILVQFLHETDACQSAGEGAELLVTCSVPTTQHMWLLPGRAHNETAAARNAVPGCLPLLLCLVQTPAKQHEFGGEGCEASRGLIYTYIKMSFNNIKFTYIIVKFYSVK